MGAMQLRFLKVETLLNSAFKQKQLINPSLTSFISSLDEPEFEKGKQSCLLLPFVDKSAAYAAFGESCNSIHIFAQDPQFHAPTPKCAIVC